MPQLVTLPVVTPAPTSPPTLAAAVLLVRQDIFDSVGNVPAGTPNRFADSDIERALDRAVTEYSFYAPYFQQIELATQAGVRTYALPSGTWWIDTVEYPTGWYPRQYVDFYQQVSPSVAAPPYGYFSNGVQLGLPTLSDGGLAVPGPGLATGTYYYKVTYVTPGGETLPSAEIGPFSLGAPGNGHAVLMSGLPTGPMGAVSARNVYRTTLVGTPGSEVFCVQVADNTTTTVLDSTPDSGLVSRVPPTVDGTGGVQLFTMKIDDDLLPADTSGIITVSTASEHLLVASGTTLPLWHRDTIILGATAYALLAYQTPTNDFFDYQDGEMRDHVDQTNVPASWLKTGQALLARFTQRLEMIKRQDNSSQAAVVHWGDKPSRWDRL